MIITREALIIDLMLNEYRALVCLYTMKKRTWSDLDDYQRQIIERISLMTQNRDAS